jgi:type I restriction enzyme S subunit
LRITDINDDGQLIAGSKVSVDAELEEGNYLTDGDVVLARTGASVGKSSRYRERDGRLVFAGFLIRVQPDASKLSSALLASYLTTRQYWDWVRGTSARSGQPGINASEYAVLPIPTPSSETDEYGLAEQQKIADCLTSLDDVIAAQGRKVEALQAHKKGLMQQLFPPRRRNSAAAEVPGVSRWGGVATPGTWHDVGQSRQ